MPHTPEKPKKPTAALHAEKKTDQKKFEMLQTRRSPNRFLSFSPQFRLFVQKYPGVLSAVYKTIQQNMAELTHRGKTIGVPGFPVQVISDFTGHEMGSMSFLRLRVQVGKKAFFVKVGRSEHLREQSPQSALERFKLLEDYLAGNKHRVYGFNVHTLCPHLAYSDARFRYWVTDFFEAGPTQSISEVFGNSKARETLEHIRDELEWWHEMDFDIKEGNAFFFPKVKTILIFDV